MELETGRGKAKAEAVEIAFDPSWCKSKPEIQNQKILLSGANQQVAWTGQSKRSVQDEGAECRSEMFKWPTDPPAPKTKTKSWGAFRRGKQAEEGSRGRVRPIEATSLSGS